MRAALPRRERAGRSLNPGQIAWRQLKKNRFAMAGLAILVALYTLAVFADFVSPYAPDRQQRELFLHPPTALIFHDPNGRFSLRPYVAGTRRTPSDDYARNGQWAPLRFFVRGYRYRLLGFLPLQTHLFGTDDRAPLFLLGTDALGRDEFSRLLSGSQISLSIGLVAILITFSLGLTIGGISGYYGGVLDEAVMRLCELIMTVPQFYLLIALAGAIPPSWSPAVTYLLIIVILSLVGWAGLARVIRGMSLSARQREYVEAARALGISDGKIIWRHVLPNTFSYAIVAATLAVPSYILGEAGLSFLGLGIRDPMASWGNMLTAAENLEVLTRDVWILAPGFFIFLTVMAYNFLGDGLRDALDPKLRR